AAQYPEIRVTLDTSQRLVDLALDAVDIAIRFSSLEKPARNWTLLSVETLLPVCSPKLRPQFTFPADPKALLQAPLIHVTVASADWSHWFRASGMEVPPSIEGGLRVDTMQMGFDAAKCDLGVVLGRHPLVDDDLESGRLFPLASEAIPSGNGYW